MRIIEHYIKTSNPSMSLEDIGNLREEVESYEELFKRFEKATDIIENGVREKDRDYKRLETKYFELDREYREFRDTVFDCVTINHKEQKIVVDTDSLQERLKVYFKI